MRRSAPVLAPAVLVGLLALAGCGDPRTITASGGGDRCTGCHGSADNAAPPHSTTGATSTADVGVGAHQSHVRAGIGCAECHPVPSAVASPGHMDGKVDVVFGKLAGGDAARWDRETRTCAVYCHGSTLSGGTATRPIWTKVDGSQAACGACHGTPPPSPHPGNASCASCHPAAVAADGGLVRGGAHLNGTIDMVEAACGSCHGIPPPAPHTSSTACGSCHSGYTSTSVNAALHRNGTVDVLSVEAACGSCHGIPPPAPHTSSTSCGSCHSGYTSTSVNPALHRNGTVDVLSVEAACGSCHGIPPPAPHTSSTSCGSCHSGYTSTSVNPALHRNGTVDVSAQACGSCHAIPPSTGRHGEHVFEERLSCGQCHPGASPTTGGSGHLNGVTDVSAPGWNSATKSCANACHGTERWYGGD